MVNVTAMAAMLSRPSSPMNIFPMVTLSLFLASPFITSIGLYLDITKAGTRPAARDRIRMTATANIHIAYVLNKAI